MESCLHIGRELLKIFKLCRILTKMDFLNFPDRIRVCFASGSDSQAVQFKLNVFFCNYLVYIEFSLVRLIFPRLFI